MAPRILTLIAALVAALAAAAPASADLKVGIADDNILLKGDPAAAREAVADWQRMGVDTVRIQVQWSRIAPVPDAYEPPADFDPANHQDFRYRWGDVDRAVRMVKDGGMAPLLMIDGPQPLWSSANPRAGNPRYLTSSWHFGQFSAAVAARYGDLVDEYILWNEPNLPVWLQPQATCRRKRCDPVSPHTYRYMVRAAYPRIHQVDPTSRVLAGAMAPTGGNLRSRNANMRPLRFLRAFGCVDAKLRPRTDGACRFFEPATVDGFAYHPHSTKHPPDEDYPRPDDVALADLKALERTLDGLQRGGRLIGTTAPLGLWLDEYAYQTNPPDKVRGVTPGRQDRYMQQAAYLAWRDKRVQLLAQYLYRDEEAGGGKRYTGWQSGLISASGVEKPALAHFDDPLFVDFKGGVIWGQIRPGTVHDVEVQVRAPGAGTKWQRLAGLRTAGDGSFVTRAAIEPFAAYRAVYDGGRTTGTQVAVPPRADDVTGKAEFSDGLLVERRAVAETAGAPVPSSFAGLSIEWRSVPDYIGSNGVVNPVFANLSRLLERGGGSPPTLRFGGDSTDHTWWNPEGKPKPNGIVTDIDPAWLAHLAQWVRTARTPLVLGLNMGLGDPQMSAALAAAAKAALPPGTIRAFELGNEPDLYPTPRQYVVGKSRLARLQKRPVGYGYDAYRSEVREYVDKVHAAVPDAGLLAGGFASGAWDDLQDSIFEQEPVVKLWGVHAYPLQTCDPEVRRRGGARYIPKILAPGAFKPIIDRASHLSAVAASNGAKVVFSEMNSAICGGLRGVSDTFASALWGTDVLFGLASEGVRNVDFHTWTGSNYGPLEWTRDAAGRPVAEVRPLFYALWLFNRAAPRGSKLLAVGPNSPNAMLKTWGTVDRKGTRRFVVINKDFRAGRKVVLDVPDAATGAKVTRLSAPFAKSETKTRFGGQGFGATTTGGVPRGRRVSERLQAVKGSFRLTMPPAGAALVEVPAR